MFVGESGSDTGGVSREFFTLLAKAIHGKQWMLYAQCYRRVEQTFISHFRQLGSSIQQRHSAHYSIFRKIHTPNWASWLPWQLCKGVLASASFLRLFIDTFMVQRSLISGWTWLRYQMKVSDEC